MIGYCNASDTPAATDVFVGAKSQIEIDARVGDFVAFLEDRGVAVLPGSTVYDPAQDPPVRIEGWTFTKTRDDPRSFAVSGPGPKGLDS